jgi:hypothetical protein
VMSRLLLSWIVGGVAVVSGLSGAASAAERNWSDSLFAERAHDFGPVPRGAKVRHPFVLTNGTNTPISITNLRVSCGCTSGRANVSLVEPGKTAIIEAEMDTRNFVGRKSTTLFVTVMAGNQEAEVGLGVSSMILSDVVLNPGSIDFGTVGRGQANGQVLTIDRVGKPDWKVVKMVSASKALIASLQETKRANGEVGYQLNVGLRPDAPSGVVRDEIRLMTNDPETPGIPVLVTAQIRGDLSASPSLLSLGNATAAAPVQGKFIVRSSKPFSISKIEGMGDGFKVVDSTPGPKAMHVIALTYNPAEGTTRGDLHRTFRITTDLAGEAPLDVAAAVHVNP